MVKYKRLTTKRSKGVFSSFNGAYKMLCKDCRLGNKLLPCPPGTCEEILAERLGELEDKIVSGELVLKKEVLKEFAEKLKSKKTVYDNGGDGDLRAAVPIEAIDELLKEYEEQLDEFADCKTCPAWSGSDCTRNPYTEGCLKEETK